MVFLPSLCILLAVSATTNANNARSADLIRLLGPQGVNLARLDALATPRRFSRDSSEFGVQEVLLKGDGKRTYDFRAEWFQQPLDHFDGDSSHVWHQRFWVNSRYYKPGTNAPVIVYNVGGTPPVLLFESNMVNMSFAPMREIRSDGMVAQSTVTHRACDSPAMSTWKGRSPPSSSSGHRQIPAPPP